MNKSHSSPEKRKTKKSVSPKKYTLFFILIFILLLFVSELIYALRNNTTIIASFYLKQAKYSAQKLRLQQTLKYLGKASEFKLKEVDQKYPDIAIETSVTTPDFPDNPDLNETYIDYLESIDYDSLASLYESKWAKPYYTLGLLAYRHGELKLTILFWQTAINLAPEWSYFHVELANFYLTQNQLDKARNAINFCLNFHFPQNHCGQFLEKNIETGSPEPIGFWEEQIKEI